MERLPEGGQPIHAIQAEELGNAVGQITRAVELQVHRHAVAAEGKKDALAKAEQTGEAPDQVDAQGNDRQREEATQQIQPKHRQNSGRGNDGRNDHHPKDDQGPTALLKGLEHQIRPPPCVLFAGTDPRDGIEGTPRSERTPSPGPCSWWRRNQQHRPGGPACQARLSADVQHRSGR